MLDRTRRHGNWIWLEQVPVAAPVTAAVTAVGPRETQTPAEAVAVPVAPVAATAAAVTLSKQSAQYV
jgi:hypothetical protein